MKHEEMKEKLGAFQDGELSPQERLEISAHLAICVECREIQKSWQKISEVLFQSRGFVSHQETEKFVARTMEKIIPPSSKGAGAFAGLFWNFLTPALELGFAALFFFTVLGASDRFAAPDTLLLLGSNKDVAELILPSVSGQGANWFNSLLEGR